MRSITAKRFGCMMAIALLSSVIALGQDLGSANKIFGAPAKSSTSKPKGASTKPKATSSKSTPGKSTNKKITPASKPAKSVSASENAKVEPAPAKSTPANDALFEDFIDKGNAARDRRDYVAAESAYKRAKDLKPREWRAIYGLGNVYNDQQRWEDAETAYRAAILQDPSNATAHIALSYVLTQPVPAPDLSDRYVEAEREVRRAIQLTFTNPLTYDQLGAAMELRGLIGSETEAAYRRSIQLDQGFAPAYAHLGRLLRRRGLVNESAAAYKEAIAKATDPAKMIIVAEVMQSEQSFAESEILLQKALASDPKNPAGLLMLGRAGLALGKFTVAEQALMRCLVVSPYSFAANSLLATLYLRQMKLKLSENSLKQALLWVTPLEKRKLAQQFTMLGDAYSKAGDVAGAQRVYRQAKAIDGDNKTTTGE